jgi:hypothetical protein
MRIGYGRVFTPSTLSRDDRAAIEGLSRVPNDGGCRKDRQSGNGRTTRRVAVDVSPYQPVSRGLGG